MTAHTDTSTEAPVTGTHEFTGNHPWDDPYFADTLNGLIGRTPDDNVEAEAAMAAAALVYAAGSAYRNGLPRPIFNFMAEAAWDNVQSYLQDTEPTTEAA